MGLYYQRFQSGVAVDGNLPDWFSVEEFAVYIIFLFSPLLCAFSSVPKVNLFCKNWGQLENYMVYLAPILSL